MAQEPYGRFGRKNRSSYQPPKPILDASQSSVLRDQLLTEIAAFGSPDQAATSGRMLLIAKNQLTAEDAKVLEAAFERRLAEFEQHTAGVSSPPRTVPSATNGVAGRVDNVPHGIDKSALALGEPRRHRDKEHLRFVASHPCMVCGRNPTDAHHLRFAQPRTLGRKVGDQYTVPLCRTHHQEAHHVGNERAWWKSTGINPIDRARALWTKTRQGVSSPPRRTRLRGSPRNAGAKENGANGAG